MNIALDSALAFDYPHPTIPGVLRVGGDSAGTLLGGTNDFVLMINDFTTTPTFRSFSFCQTAPPGCWGICTPYKGTVTVTAVPLPAAALLFGSGLLALLRPRLRKRWGK